MTISEHSTEFAGKPLIDWETGAAISDPEGMAYALRWGYDDDDSLLNKLAEFLDDQAASRVTTLVIGVWSNEDDSETAQAIIDALVIGRDRLPNLTALFFGDIIYEENEISWIEQGNYGALWNAYPQLEHVRIRGGNNLDLGALNLPNLRTLTIETGGLPRTVINQITQAHLPKLEHLELWLGVEDYGATWTMDDLAPIFAGTQYPNLRSLGLRDSDQQDELAAAIATAPILNQLETLDLSMGTLGDTGAQALLASEAIKKLKKLDLHHHYCTPAMIKKLKALPIDIDLSGQEGEGKTDPEDRYVAVSE